MRLVRVAGSGTGLVLDVDDRLYVIDIATSASALRSDNAELARRIDALFTNAQQSWIPMINNWPDARESLRQLTVVAVDNLAVSCSVNREVRQRGNTIQMTHSFGRIAAYVSRFVPLAAGDVIVSGTPPGTAIESGLDGKFLQSGDYVTVCVDGVDMLTNQICFAD